MNEVGGLADGDPALVGLEIDPVFARVSVLVAAENNGLAVLVSDSNADHTLDDVVGFRPRRFPVAEAIADSGDAKLSSVRLLLSNTVLAERETVRIAALLTGCWSMLGFEQVLLLESESEFELDDEEEDVARGGRAE